MSKLGVGASLACAVHCMALPLVAGAAAAAPSHLTGMHWLEVAMVAIAAVIGYRALGAGYHRHRRLLPFALLTVGLAMIGLGHLGHVGHVGHASEPSWMPVLGALSVAAAQLLNLRLRTVCCDAA